MTTDKKRDPKFLEKGSGLIIQKKGETPKSASPKK